MTPEQLKASILQYAMEGKLVKQDPNDEPASDTVKTKSMEESRTEPYKIPVNWKWIRLGSGVRFINGRAYKKSELLTDSNLTPVLRVGNLFTNSSWYYSDLKLDKDKYIDNGDLIYAWSASFGPRIWNGGHVIYHYHIWKTVIKEGIDKKFLYYFLSDPHNVLGETKLHGSTMKHVTKTNMEKLPFPLPPLEEQKRIVAKIEKLMPLVDEYAESYNRLQKIDNEFEDKLKQSVLQYAMEGKLVKQNLSDEPASELVKKIENKKAELIKEGKIKKSKKLPTITDDEKPFNIPDNWAWSRLGDLFTILRGGSPRPIKSFLTNDENGINWIKIGDTDPNSKYITKTEEKIIPEGLKKSRAVHIGDFVLSNSMSFGRPYILKINGAVHDGWLIISDYDQVFNKDFLYYLLLSSFVKKQFSIAATGSTVKNLNRERVANTIGVIPPLEEQKRIVAKIQKLQDSISSLSK